jgi:Flp pilus assembly pilin Flp
MASRRILHHIRDNERGASMLQYALLASLLAVVVLVSAGVMGREARATFYNVGWAVGGTGFEFDPNSPPPPSR